MKGIPFVSICAIVCRLSGWKVLFYAISTMSLLTTAVFLLYGGRDPRTPMLSNKRTDVVQNITQAKLLLVPQLQRRLLLLILVPSAPPNFERRNIIRKTWGNSTGDIKLSNSTESWKVVFVLGKKSDFIDAEVAAEARKNGDILMGELRDSYKNLVVKTLTGFSWAMTVNICTYVLKADDDVYIYVPGLIKWLSNPQLPVRLYAGHVHYGSIPATSTTSKYFQETYTKSYYPSYCGGPFYILSTNILGDILHASRFYKLLTIEDVYMGILAESLHITPLHVWKFKIYFPSFSESDFDELSACDFASLLSIGHQMSTTLIQNLHAKFKELGSSDVDIVCFWQRLYLALSLCGIFYILFVAACVIYRKMQS